MIADSGRRMMFADPAAFARDTALIDLGLHTNVRSGSGGMGRVASWTIPIRRRWRGGMGAWTAFWTQASTASSAMALTPSSSSMSR
jgi:hypothetical protein